MADPLIRQGAAPAPVPADTEKDATHRVRIGLTGLCAVFVLVLLAAAVFGLTPAEKGVRPPPESETTANATDPKDPLAELGLTPGGSASDEAASEPAPAPPPRPAAPKL